MGRSIVACLCISIFWFNFCLGQQYNITNDIVFAQTPERTLALDLYLPKSQGQPYLIIWVHGGAWHSGSKDNPPKDLLQRGYALASIDYRLTVEAAYPAQIFDIKAAIRFLRAHATQYGYRSDKIFIWGSSAGGHLAALAGVTNGLKSMEGSLGDNLTESSDIQGIIDFYGPSNLTTILDQSTPHGLNVRTPALALMFGKPLDQCKSELENASPVMHVSPDDPPLFILHGDQDIQVPVNQSIELFGKYRALNLPVQLEWVYGAGHGGKKFSDSVLIDNVISFLQKIIHEK
ncbi:MAG: alpha/beta hydrolase [Saprospiraceae bacterium]